MSMQYSEKHSIDNDHNVLMFSTNMLPCEKLMTHYQAYVGFIINVKADTVDVSCLQYCQTQSFDLSSSIFENIDL